MAWGGRVTQAHPLHCIPAQGPSSGGVVCHWISRDPDLNTLTHSLAALQPDRGRLPLGHFPAPPQGVPGSGEGHPGPRG